MSIFFMHDTPLASPLPLWERSDCIARCNPGEGLRTIDRPEPLTPTLSHKGRGSSVIAEIFCPVREDQTLIRRTRRDRVQPALDQRVARRGRGEKFYQCFAGLR